MAKKRRGRRPGVPSYRLYKRTGQAIVCTDGEYHYLGEYGSPASRAEYNRLKAEWLANGRRLQPALDDEPGGPTLMELANVYRKHAEAWYVKNGRPTSDQFQIRQVIHNAIGQYGECRIAEFGPLKLKAGATVRR